MMKRLILWTLYVIIKVVQTATTVCAAALIVTLIIKWSSLDDGFKLFGGLLMGISLIVGFSLILADVYVMRKIKENKAIAMVWK